MVSSWQQYVNENLTGALWWLSAQSKASPQDPDQRRGQLQAGRTPPVEPGPQQNGKVSHLQIITAEEELNIQCVYKYYSNLTLPVNLLLCKPQTSKWRNDIVEFNQGFCILTSWGISWSRMAKVVRNPTCKDSLINSVLSYLEKKCALWYRIHREHLSWVLILLCVLCSACRGKC